MAKAFHIARSGRPGPVHVELPRLADYSEHILQEEKAPLPPYRPIPAVMPVPDPGIVEHCAQQLMQAKSPVFAAGKGVIRKGAMRQLSELALKLQAPVVCAQDAIGVVESDRLKPKVISSQIIRNIDPHQTQLINRTRHGHMILAGQTLYVMEVQPAAYAALAANEAEKRAALNILEVRAFGSFGRIYLGGEERDIMAGYQAAIDAIEGVAGRETDARKSE